MARIRWKGLVLPGGRVHLWTAGVDDERSHYDVARALGYSPGDVLASLYGAEEGMSAHNVSPDLRPAIESALDAIGVPIEFDELRFG